MYSNRFAGDGEGERERERDMANPSLKIAHFRETTTYLHIICLFIVFSLHICIICQLWSIKLNSRDEFPHEISQKTACEASKPWSSATLGCAAPWMWSVACNAWCTATAALRCWTLDGDSLAEQTSDLVVFRWFLDVDTCGFRDFSVMEVGF